MTGRHQVNKKHKKSALPYSFIRKVDIQQQQHKVYKMWQCDTLLAYPPNSRQRDFLVRYLYLERKLDLLLFCLLVHITFCSCSQPQIWQLMRAKNSWHLDLWFIRKYDFIQGNILFSLFQYLHVHIRMNSKKIYSTVSVILWCNKTYRIKHKIMWHMGRF
jgi:hypothetical protein